MLKMLLSHRSVSPAAVDVSSGVEQSKGLKTLPR